MKNAGSGAPCAWIWSYFSAFYRLEIAYEALVLQRLLRAFIVSRIFEQPYNEALERPCGLLGGLIENIPHGLQIEAVLSDQRIHPLFSDFAQLVWGAT